MAMKWCTKLQHRRGALLFFQVIRQISWSHGTKKTLILTQIGHFRTVTLIWMHWWLLNDAQSCNIEEMPYCFSRSSVKFHGHTGQKIYDFDPNWAFPDCNSSLNSPMALKWCAKLDVVWKRCPIVFQGHASNSKVTQNKILSILTRIERFQTVTPVWIHPWLWNDAQSLILYRRGALLFSKVIHQISRSHGTKNHQFWPELSVSGL